MDKDGEVHAWSPPQTGPRRHRSRGARQDARQHANKCGAVDRRAPIEGDGAASLQQKRTRVDLTIAMGLLMVRGQPRAVLTRSPWIFGGPRYLVDERPRDVSLAQLTCAA